MSEERFVIAWRSRPTGLTGRGMTLFTKPEAEEICARLNGEEREFVHWIEEAGPPVSVIESEGENTHG